MQQGDELATDDPAGAVHAYMEALELGTAGERLQVGRSLSNAQLLLCKNLAREGTSLLQEEEAPLLEEELDTQPEEEAPLLEEEV